MVLAGSLWGAGNTRSIANAMILGMWGMWGVRMPLALVAVLWLRQPVSFIWPAMIADWTVRMGLLLWLYQSKHWRPIEVIR
jgi:Na+-driven multidrug efflux pump